MSDLLDMAPASETVDLRAGKIEVFGVSARGLAHLIGRFPELREMMTGGAIDAQRLIAIGGEAVEAIIAAGIGHPGSADYEAAAGRLSLEEQVAILSAVIRLTLPNGLAPLAARLQAIGGIIGGNPEPATKSPKRSTR